MKNKYICSVVTAAMVMVCGCTGNGPDKAAQKNSTDTAATIPAPKKRRALSLCSSQLPPEAIEKYKAIIRQKENVPTDIAAESSSASAVSLLGSPWRKRTITVIFTDGDSIVQARVRTTALKWEKYANIKFNFAASAAKPDISVSFQRGKGTNSRIGKYSAGFRPSMYFDDLNPDDDDYYYDYYVLHEFGHALGLMHEHQSPNSNVVWNVSALEKYCAAFNPPWSPTMVREQIIDQFARSQVLASDFDPTSIMMYSFPSNLVESGNVPAYGNSAISTTDSIHIRRLYPFPATP
ncbi:M12 family metallopeptidase [Chitinophagaceae bacterium MMS25-I14]